MAWYGMERVAWQVEDEQRQWRSCIAVILCTVLYSRMFIPQGKYLAGIHSFKRGKMVSDLFFSASTVSNLLLFTVRLVSFSFSKPVLTIPYCQTVYCTSRISVEDPWQTNLLGLQRRERAMYVCCSKCTKYPSLLEGTLPSSSI